MTLLNCWLYCTWSPLPSELPVLWDNSVPCCVSQCDLGFCHMQSKAFWVIYSLCPKQIHVRWILFYSDNIGRSSLPCLLAADSDWLISVFSQGLYFRPRFFKKAARNQSAPIFSGSFGLFRYLVVSLCLFVPSFISWFWFLALISVPALAYFAFYIGPQDCLIDLFSSLLPTAPLSPDLSHPFLPTLWLPCGQWGCSKQMYITFARKNSELRS